MNKRKYIAVAAALILAACVDDSSTDAHEPTDVAANYLNPDYSYGEMTDTRDGQTYKTTVIGSQTWMAQNLNYATANSHCYGKNADSCAKYGRLYKWDDAMGACPGGWHLPDTTEWNTLLEEVGGKDSAVVQLISSNGWSRKDYALSVLDSMLEDINPEGRSELPQAWGGTDSYGFSALPAGFRTDNDIFTTATGMAVFWTSTEKTWDYVNYVNLETFVDAHTMEFPLLGYYVYNVYESKNSESSVRCVKD